MSKNAKCLTFALLFFLTFFVHLIGTSIHFHHLMFREVGSAAATVFKTTPESHAAVYYRYAVDGRTFEGVGSSIHYQTGDRVRIIYATGEPDDSELQENIPTAMSLFGFAFLGALFLASVGTAVISLTNSSGRKAVIPARIG